MNTIRKYSFLCPVAAAFVVNVAAGVYNAGHWAGYINLAVAGVCLGLGTFMVWQTNRLEKERAWLEAQMAQIKENERLFQLEMRNRELERLRSVQQQPVSGYYAAITGERP